MSTCVNESQELGTLDSEICHLNHKQIKSFPRAYRPALVLTKPLVRQQRGKEEK